MRFVTLLDFIIKFKLPLALHLDSLGGNFLFVLKRPTLLATYIFLDVGHYSCRILTMISAML